MPLIACNCTNCGAALEIDDAKETGICSFCGTKFVVENAVNYYKTVHVTMNQKEESALIRKGLRMVEKVRFDEDELAELANELSDISTNDFYPVFFSFASERNDDFDWLVKNSSVEEKRMLSRFLWNHILKRYNKESFSVFHINIVKNYSEYNYLYIDEDSVTIDMHRLYLLRDSFDEELQKRYEEIQEMAIEELNNASQHIDSMMKALAIYSYSLANVELIGENILSQVRSSAISYLQNQEYASTDFKWMLQFLRYAKSKGEALDFFRYRIADDVYVTISEIEVSGRRYPLDHVIYMSVGRPVQYMLLRIRPHEATVIRMNNVVTYRGYVGLMENCKDRDDHFFEDLAYYSKTEIEGTDAKLVYEEGFSYKVSTVNKIFSFLGKLIK